MDRIKELVETLERFNEAYRSGTPLVSDYEYDRLVEELAVIDPGHPFLHSVEPEKFEEKMEVRHPVPMLSTEKAYTKAALQRFAERVMKAAAEIGIDEVLFRVTSKLDGLAGRDDGKIFASRGNGEVGYEISSAFRKGVFVVGGRGLGLGELVIERSYFEKHLAMEFEHPRNMVVGIISSDKLNAFAKKALQDRAVRFVPYSTLPYWQGNSDELIKNIDHITTDLAARTDYPIDGMVSAVTNDTLKEYMGSTAHHYRWQLAIKTKGETAITFVEGIQWQVGRTGNVTPVLEVNPVSLSGATIKRVTGHNAGLIKKEKIGTGAEIEIIRSGEVIPKLEKVLRRSGDVNIPEECPACSSQLEWKNDFLKCKNNSCLAKIEQGIYHWFKTLGTADWFGIKTVGKLVKNGFDSLEKIYKMTEEDFVDTGFGPVQSKNLAEAIAISLSKPVEDWRFLAAFGISDLGTGDSRKLLSHISIENIVEAKAENIEKVYGFGKISSQTIEDSIRKINNIMTHMLSLGFNLQKTLLEKDRGNIDSSIAGFAIVFSGKMAFGSRQEIKIEARALGANVQSAISGKTDYLVCGENPGEGKVKKAEKADIRIISESEYRLLIKRH
jgi:DNA ligase (NAD+)